MAIFLINSLNIDYNDLKHSLEPKANTDPDFCPPTGRPPQLSRSLCTAPRAGPCVARHCVCGGCGGARILHIIKRVSCCKLFSISGPRCIAFTHSYSAQFYPYSYMELEWVHFFAGYFFCLVNAQLDCFQGSGSISKAPVAFLVSGMHMEVYFGWIHRSGTEGAWVCKYSIL